jgi:hypothetical protein
LALGNAMTIENAVIQNATPEEPMQATPLESLKAARTLQNMRRSHGVNRVDLIVEEVEGDWLEQSGEEEALESEGSQTA